jgi:putative ABC transport system ATP-binding protein
VQSLELATVTRRHFVDDVDARGTLIVAVSPTVYAAVGYLPSPLSGGQQQRVAIAGDPALILADEPTGNLDSLMARQVMDLLEKINDMGTTVVLVTHDPELAPRAQRNIHIVDGVVIDSPPYTRRTSSEPVALGAGSPPSS